MKDTKSIMSFESVLPVEFDGVFRFSNPSNEDFVGVWNSKEYLFPAGTMTPLIMSDHTPLEIQHIRKKFAKDLAEREFFKSRKYEAFRKREGEKDNLGLIIPRGQGMSHAGQYTLTDLEPYIQSCLQPLEAGELLTKPVVRQKTEDKLHRKEDGTLVTEAINDKTSLRKKALEA